MRIGLQLGKKRKIMSELIDEISSEIARARDLPLSEQPAAFEVIRLRLEAMIADTRTETTGSEAAE
jgi:hypothetical protein